MTKKYVSDKGTRQKPIRTTKWRGDKQSIWKRTQSNDRKDDLRFPKQNKGMHWEDTRKS